MIVAIDPEMGKDGWSKIRDISFATVIFLVGFILAISLKGTVVSMCLI